MSARSGVAVLLLLASRVTYAGGQVALPEPGVIELLAIGAVAAIAVAVRNRRK